MSKKILCFVLLMAIMAGLFGCVNTNTPTALTAPTLTLNNDVVNWNAIPNAVGYEVYYNGSFGKTTTDTHVTLYFTRATDIQVVAKGDGENYADSEKSNKITYVPQEKVPDGTTASLNQVELLPDYSTQYVGKLNEEIAFVEEATLLKDYWWSEMEKVFEDHTDNDGGYRSEFWGKMIRGACYSYEYTRNEAVYAMAEASIKRMLAIQAEDVDGKLSGFDVDHEFDGWDLWGRGYTLKGFKQFYGICKDAALKAAVKQSILDQVDYIMKYIGAGDDKQDILYTSPDWGGCNSCNILEGVVFAYSLTNDAKYRDYAKYIIDRGGSSMLSREGKTIVQSALDRDPMYTFGCRKIYEVTNFMEGVLQYYLATGDRYALRIVEGYYYSAASCEITVTGALGVDVEEANNSEIEQCDPSNLGRMQETCVGVSFAKFSIHLYQITGDSEIINNIEKELYNFVYGIMDHELHHDYPFFSYSPLHTMARADIYSGTAFLDDKGQYCQSCCVMSGLSMLPYIAKMGVTSRSNGFDVNLYLDGTTTTQTASGNDFRLTTQAANYEVDGAAECTVNMGRPERMTIRFHVPSWSKDTTVKVNGTDVQGVVSGEYLVLDRTWRDGDMVELQMDMRAYVIKGSEHCSNPNGQYNVAVKRGPLVFARDYRLEGDSIFNPLTFVTNEQNELTVQVVETPSFTSQCQLKVLLESGEYVTLVDYGSAGKTMDDESIMCCWIPTKDYYSADLTKPLVVRTHGNNEPLYFNNACDNTLFVVSNYATVTDKEALSQFAWTFEEQSNGKYLIKVNATQDYLTVNGSLLVHSAANGKANQLFTIVRCGMNKYQIVTSDGLVLSRYSSGALFPIGSIYCEYNINHADQYWTFDVL